MLTKEEFHKKTSLHIYEADQRKSQTNKQEKL